MAFTSLMTDLASAIVSLLEILLPGAVGAVVETFDAFAFTTTGDTTTMTAAFGWIVLAGVLSLGIAKGTEIKLIADGVDESIAIDGLAELIDSEFGEK